MILSKKAIIENIENGNIITSDYNHELINNQSIDVRLGRWVYCQLGTSHQFWHDLDKEPLKLYPGCFYIAHTEEFIGTKAESGLVPSFKLKSTAGRAGIMHTLAGLGDCGFFNRWALEFTVAVPLTLERYTRIGQIYFNETTEGGNYVKETGNYQKADNLEELMANWDKDSILPVPLKVVKPNDTQKISHDQVDAAYTAETDEQLNDYFAGKIDKSLKNKNI